MSRKENIQAKLQSIAEEGEGENKATGEENPARLLPHYISEERLCPRCNMWSIYTPARGICAYCKILEEK